MLIDANGLDQMRFERWAFCPGMQFNSMKKWWGDHGQRDFPHEGVDFCLFQDGSNRILRLNEKNRIPVIYDGIVKAIFKDYLGQAVIIEHDHLLQDGRKILSIYAHTNPRPHIQFGVRVYKGDIIASLADTSSSKANIIPHLHFSMGLPSPSLSYDGFFWNIIRKPDLVTLLDPLYVIDIPCQVLNPDEAYCLQL
jgi:murein DD-endopeptidase MepM/ murein hydrolase activator NlpD